MLYPAGHVLGAAMIQLEIDGVRVLYTGDYSMDEDRHLMQAEAPVDNPPNVLIIESTFGLQKHESREVREKRFLGGVNPAGFFGVARVGTLCTVALCRGR